MSTPQVVSRPHVEPSDRHGDRRLWRRVLAAFLILGSGGCASRDRPEITAEELEAHVATLDPETAPGHGVASALYDSAAAYIARTLEAAGVQPGATDRDGKARFVQPVPLIRNLVGDHTALELTRKGVTKRIQEGARSFLLVAPGQAGAVIADRTPVFVGNGIHAPEYGVDELAGLDLVGRPVLITATPPDSSALAGLPLPVREAYADPAAAQHRRMSDLIERGAAAILLVPDRWLMDEWDAMSAMRRRLDYGPSERYPGHVLRSPVPIVLLHADLVDRLFLGRGYHPISHVGRYRSFGLDGVTVRLDVDVRGEPRVTANVIGLVPGLDPELRDQYVIVSAQLDGAGRAGVTDASEDAAACAALLEVAAAVRRERPKRSVLFVFFVVEGGGVWGSLHLLAHPPVPREDVAAAIHVGSVGRPDGPFRTLKAVASPARLAREVEGVAREGRLEVRTSSNGGAAFRGTPTEVFLDAGIPSMLVTIRDRWSDRGERPGATEGARGLAEATEILRVLVTETARARSFGAVHPTAVDLAAGR